MKTAFGDPDERARLMTMVASVTKERPTATPARSSTSWPPSRRWPTRKVGTTGYCMGGGLALDAAGRFPDRVGAAASFHGGQLASDGPRQPAPAGRLDAGDGLRRRRRERRLVRRRAVRAAVQGAERAPASTTRSSPTPRCTASPSPTTRPTTRPPRRATGRRSRSSTPPRSAPPDGPAMRYADTPTAEVEVARRRAGRAGVGAGHRHRPAGPLLDRVPGRPTGSTTDRRVGARFGGRNAAPGDRGVGDDVGGHRAATPTGPSSGRSATSTTRRRAGASSSNRPATACGCASGARSGRRPSGLTPAIQAMPDKEERIVARRLDEFRANMQATVEGIKELAEADAVTLPIGVTHRPVDADGVDFVRAGRAPRRRARCGCRSSGPTTRSHRSATSPPRRATIRLGDRRSSSSGRAPRRCWRCRRCRCRRCRAGGSCSASAPAARR